MQVWKSFYRLEFIFKSYLENFAFLSLLNVELFTREVRVFLKK